MSQASSRDVHALPLDHPETWQVLSDGRRAPLPARTTLRPASSSASGSTPAPTSAATCSSGTSRTSSSRSGRRPLRGLGMPLRHLQGLFRDRYGSDIPGTFTPEVKAFRESSLIDLLTELCRHGREKGLRNALCLIPTDVATHGFLEPQERLQKG